MILLVLIVPAILVFSWFKEGLILGVAEDGLIFHNLSNYFKQAQYTWMEYPGLGSPSLSLIAAKPTYFLLSLLQEMQIPGYLIQAGVMWVLLVSSGIGVYLLVKEFFPNLPFKYVLLSICFYWFNPIALADVWNRFLLNYIFFFALLPVGSYFYIKGLRSRSYYWILPFSISLLFYSLAFSYLAFSILLWVWLSLVTFFYFLLNKNRQIRFFSLKYFISSLIIFIISNCWWLLPLFSLNILGGTSSTANLFTIQNNTGLLDALSKSVGNLTGIFKLTNASFLAPDSLAWVKVYTSPLLSLFMVATVGVIIYFFIKFRKNPEALFLGSLFLTAILLAKGNNPPFGEVYDFVYKKVIFFQVFRNPFEKFGYLLALVSSILLSPSIFELIKQSKGGLSKLIYPFFFIVIIFYLGFPLYSNLAFTNKFQPANNYSIGYKVKVPEYYKDANNWLINQGNNFRYIGLPLKDEGITYNWEKGYAGVELNVALFTNSGIIHNTSVPFFNQIVPEVEKLLTSDSNFSNLANLVNARYYILRYDIDYQLRAMTDPLLIEKALNERETKGEVKKAVSFGMVSVWENLKWQDNTFYAVKKLINVKSYDDYFDLSKIDTLQKEALIDQGGLEKVNKTIGDSFDSEPNISYEKVNSTKYILHIKNASKPFLIFFSELYNDGWKAFYESGEIADNHIRINKFGNGWIINKQGSYDLNIEFVPQKYMDLGEKISFVSYLLIAGGSLVLRVKRKI